ncbi:hypothetical protein HRI_000271000 [Hibiscus trionum]|uniref:BZIP domain-containing protein n=1 Tax=Hibiscus trionum TaxID=183268 RepID=A0A9W7LIF9_HIBTR|nr:hypothetical protein HRI_000271000 [Hibiscus trionum]
MKKPQLAGTEAEGQDKQKGAKSGKTQAQKDAHNKSCQRSRQKMKRRREDLEEVETKYYEMAPKFKKIQTENREMKLELEASKSIIRKMENDMQQLRTTLEAQGQNFTSSDELEGWILSQANVHDGQAPVLNDVDKFVGLGATGTGNFPLYTADFYQQMVFGQDYTNTASAANHAGSSSAAGVWINSAAGSLDANYDLSEFGVTNQHDNFFNNDLAAGVPTHSAAAPSLGPNSELPIAHNATNNHGNADDLFTLGPAAGNNSSSALVHLVYFLVLP